MAYENYTIRQFMDALFKGDRSVISDEELSIVKLEYIDTAGLYETEEFSKVRYIEYLHGRINYIKIALRLQREFIEEFEMPYLPGIYELKKKGHIINWKKDKDAFLKQLAKIEKNEFKYTSEIETCIKQLTEFRDKQNKGTQPVELTRSSFIRTINVLGKLGFRIDKDKDSPEDLAFMIKQQTEDNKSAS